MPRDFRVRMILSVLGVSLSLALVAPAPETTSSALEQDPQGWIDLLDGAGTELKGWTRGPIPPEAKLDAESQWRLDPRTGILTCEGTGGHDWVRWDRELGDFIYHVEWRFTPVVSGKKAYNSGIYAGTRPTPRSGTKPRRATPKGDTFSATRRSTVKSSGSTSPSRCTMAA